MTEEDARQIADVFGPIRDLLERMMALQERMISLHERLMNRVEVLELQQMYEPASDRGPADAP